MKNKRLVAESLMILCYIFVLYHLPLRWRQKALALDVAGIAGILRYLNLPAHNRYAKNQKQNSFPREIDVPDRCNRSFYIQHYLLCYSL